MAAAAYILIDIVGDKVGSTLEALRSLEGVRSANSVAGPYDIIAKVEAADVHAVGQLVVTKIRPIEGVHETVTCFVMD